MSVVDNLRSRIKVKNDGIDVQSFNDNQSGLQNMKTRLNIRGGVDQWTRMREDKLFSLKRALFSSYQRAIVQKYDVKKDGIISNIITIISFLQDQKELSDTQKQFLSRIENEYDFTETDRTSLAYVRQLEGVLDQISSGNEEPQFRCLINHDKLKVDYEDKIISIPFEECPEGSDEVMQTGFHNGTVFKWVHGNKEEWTPNTYWIVYMQYSEETAYFRAEIRKADQQIQIVTIDDQGNESTVTYRGWMTGPNETNALWNVKKGVAWNDLNYTKLLYITKDEDTLAFFQRFDRIIINGKPWEVQAYNESYSTSKGAGTDSGIIRVALKETYTGTDQLIQRELTNMAQEQIEQAQYDAAHTEARIDGPEIVKPFDVVTFVAKNFEQQGEWTLFDTALAKIKNISADGLTVTVEIITGKSNKEGFYINYGNSEETKQHIKIESL